MSGLDEIEQAVAQVATQVGGSVVGIGRGSGRGSGVVFADGLVATNAHNIRGDEVTVVFAGARSAVGQVRGVDVDGDLAVVAVDTEGAAPVAWAATDGLAVGTAVFALANPGGRQRVTFGLVSAVDRAFRGPRGRRIAGSVEHTAPLARGSSGGPIVNRTGELLGLNTNRLGDGLGVGLAPARVARRLRRAVGLADQDGLLVRVVEEGSPADRAGIKAGDLIVTAAGQPVTEIDDLYEVLDGLAADAALPVSLVRGTEERTVTVTFGPGGAQNVGTA